MDNTKFVYTIRNAKLASYISLLVVRKSFLMVSVASSFSSRTVLQQLTALGMSG